MMYWSQSICAGSIRRSTTLSSGSMGPIGTVEVSPAHWTAATTSVTYRSVGLRTLASTSTRPPRSSRNRAFGNEEFDVEVPAETGAFLKRHNPLVGVDVEVVAPVMLRPKSPTESSYSQVSHSVIAMFSSERSPSQIWSTR